jgi:hypothetical protein
MEVYLGAVCETDQAGILLSQAALRAAVLKALGTLRLKNPYQMNRQRMHCCKDLSEYEINLKLDLRRA